MAKTVLRSYDQPDGYVEVTHLYTPIIGTAPSSWTLQEVTTRRLGRYVGVHTDNYRAKMAAGEFIPFRHYIRMDLREDNPQGTYGGTYVKTTNPQKSYHYDVNSVRSVVGGSSSLVDLEGHYSRMAEDVSLTALQQEALAKLSPALDALTESVEFHKSLAMLVGARRRAKDLIGQALRGGLQTAKAASSAWLEWRYGWQTLGYLIEDSEEFVKVPTLNGFDYTAVSSKVVKTESTSTNTPYSGYYVKHDYISEITRTLYAKVNVAVRFRANTQNYSVNPLATAWELTPFSWVADWFVTVGDTLKAWEVLAKAQAFTSAAGYHLEEVGFASVSNVTLGTGTYATAPRASGEAWSNASYRRRIPLGGLSPLPQLRTRLNSKRIADAAALLTTRIL